MKWDAFDDIRTPAAWLDQAKELTETPRRRRRTWSPRAKGRSSPPACARRWWGRPLRPP